MAAVLTESKEKLEMRLQGLKAVVSEVADRTNKPIISSAANYLDKISNEVNDVELTPTYGIRHSR